MPTRGRSRAKSNRDFSSFPSIRRRRESTVLCIQSGLFKFPTPIFSPGPRPVGGTVSRIAYFSLPITKGHRPLLPFQNLGEVVRSHRGRRSPSVRPSDPTSLRSSLLSYPLWSPFCRRSSLPSLSLGVFRRSSPSDGRRIPIVRSFHSTQSGPHRVEIHGRKGRISAVLLLLLHCDFKLQPAVRPERRRRRHETRPPGPERKDVGARLTLDLRPSQGNDPEKISRHPSPPRDGELTSLESLVPNGTE